MNDISPRWAQFRLPHPVRQHFTLFFNNLNSHHAAIHSKNMARYITRRI